MQGGFDPEGGERLLAPDEPGRGHWVGAPCLYRDPDDGRLLLWVRDRRPRPRAGRVGADDDARGFRGRLLALGPDGPRTLFSLPKRALRARSVEGAALRRTRDGLELWVSYETTGRVPRWRLAVLRAPTPERLEPASARDPELSLPALFGWSVKDPVLLERDGGTWLYLDGLRLGRPMVTTGVMHAEGGGAFRFRGDLFEGSPSFPWTRTLRRLTGILPVAGGYLGFLDGAPRRGDVCEERAGLAWGATPERLRVADASPRFVSPRGTGSCRYLFARPGPEAALELLWELSVGDGEHELRRTALDAAQLTRWAETARTAAPGAG